MKIPKEKTCIFNATIPLQINQTQKSGPNWSVVTKAIQILSKMNVMFKENDIVKLKNLPKETAQFNGCKGVISKVTGAHAFYYSYNLYTVIVDIGAIITELDNIGESQIEPWTDSEEWPPVCKCPREVWLYKGCECGAMLKERQGKLK